jgi:hypothetical protein
MNKVLVGLVLGAVLGMFDGATAWFTPEVRPAIIGIIIGSTIKGIIAGVAAGIFARKVRSTAAGVAFGLAVGLVLAYAVAAMQGKYYFEIMLPGGTVGAILGWATQRYGRPASARHAAAAIAMFAVALFNVSAYADQNHDHNAKPAASAPFNKLKALAGKHSPAMVKADGVKTKVEYRVTAGGSAVIETMFVGEPHEMVTVYSQDGDSVVATHYCSGGNQPVMRLNTNKSNANELVFDFVSVTGKSDGGHINAVRFSFDGYKVREVWSTTTKDDYLTLFYE